LAYNALHLSGFSEEMARLGSTVVSTVLEQRLLTPRRRIADQLQMAPTEQVVAIVRLRQVDQMPLLLETSYIPTRFCPGLESVDLAERSLYTLLETEYQLSVQRATQSLEATTVNEYEQQLFHLAPGTAMLLLEGVTYNQNDQPFEYFKAIYRGDRFKFVLKSQRNGVDVAVVSPQARGNRQ
jgi:GntR family transcriptional regulator